MAIKTLTREFFCIVSNAPTIKKIISIDLVDNLICVYIAATSIAIPTADPYTVIFPNDDEYGNSPIYLFVLGMPNASINPKYCCIIIDSEPRRKKKRYNLITVSIFFFDIIKNPNINTIVGIIRILLAALKRCFESKKSFHPKGIK